MNEPRQTSKSSLWEYRYAPTSIKDLVLPNKIISYLNDCVSRKDIPNLLMYGSAGRGKTSTAYALCNDIDADYMYINGSVETSVDIMRDKVIQFATTYSMEQGKKVIIFDEVDRLSPNAADALKGIVEQVETNCRFIFTTNSFSKIISPILSRCHVFNYDFTPEESGQLMISYFKRMCGILKAEQIEYDKAILAKYVQLTYPDFRKTLNKLQQYVMINGSVDSKILIANDDVIGDLITEIKGRKFICAEKIVKDLDYSQFYSVFYSQIKMHIQPESIPDVILIINASNNCYGVCADKFINVMGCVTEVMKSQIKWK